MKKIVFIMLLSMGTMNIVQAQFLKSIKAKAKAAVDNSIDRSTDKVIDKAINKPADNTTDTVLNKTGRTVNSIFKKKNKTDADPEQNKIPRSDSMAVKPIGADSSFTVVSTSDSTATVHRNQN